MLRTLPLIVAHILAVHMIPYMVGEDMFYQIGTYDRCSSVRHVLFGLPGLASDPRKKNKIIIISIKTTARN